MLETQQIYISGGKEHRILRKEASNPDLRLKMKKENELIYFTFPLLDRFSWLVNGFSSRLGGVSTGDTASLNLGYERDASRKTVDENHKRFAAAVGYPYERTVLSRQTHTTNIRVVTEADAGSGVMFERPYQDVDGLITNIRQLPLMTFYADCVPLLMVDEKKHAIGCSHSGWRGTVGNIGRETLRAMQREFGTMPEDVFCAIGPSICQDCYEVSEDVIEQFQKAYRRDDWSRLFFQKDNGKYQLNLWEACRINFVQAGVPEEQISVPDICTCCNPELLFSHRASHGRRGNLAAVLMLK